jgi:hypothetical protein
MKKFVAVLSAIVFCAVSGYAIEGSYNVSGSDPYWEQKEYKGTVEITKDKNDVFQAKWVIDGNVSMGTGLKTGNMVSFIFKSPESEKKQEEGVVVYKIEKNVLEGSFVYLGKSLVGKEKLEKK